MAPAAVAKPNQALPQESASLGRTAIASDVSFYFRYPADSEKCSDLGIMEGRLCGQVVEPGHNPALRACQVVAAYRIKFDPGLDGGQGAIVGTLEAVLVCPCTA